MSIWGVDSAARRVKVFICRDNGNWEDQGTGYLFFGFLESAGGYCFRVKSEEEPPKIILDCVANKAVLYERQQDTLLVWCEPRTEDELALSFAEKGGCDWFKNQLDNFRTGSEPLSDDFQDKEILSQVMIDDSHSSFSPPAVEVIEFPSPLTAMAALEIIDLTLDPLKRETLVTSVMKSEQSPTGGLFRDIFQLFQKSEEASDMDTLHILFHLMKNLILLNEPPILEIVFHQDVILNVFSVLEYDPEYRMYHRKHLSRPELFREIIPFKDIDMLQRIHQTYRIQYMKEVALARIIDDNTFATLKTKLTANQIQIVTSLQKDHDFFRTLFEELKDQNTPPPQQKRILLLLQELFTMASRCLDPQERADFYKELEIVGMWEAFPVPFQSPNPEVCFLTSNILSIAMSMNTALLRQWMFQQGDQEREDTIIHKIADLLGDRQRLFDMGEVSIVNTLFDILRLFIDTETTFDAVEKESLFRMIYQPETGILQRLKLPLDSVPSFRGMGSGEIGEIEASLFVHTCDLLKYCVEAHGQRLRMFALRTPIFSSIFKILECRVNHVLLAGIRLLRILIQRQDSFFDKLIIKDNFLKSVVGILVRTGNRYNVLNSAIIELFEFIRVAKREKLRHHIASSFSGELKGIEYVGTFSQLLSPSPQLVEATSPPREEMFDADLLGSAFLPMAEEDYFNESDEEDSIHLTDPTEDLDSSPFKPKQPFLFEEEEEEEEEDTSFTLAKSTTEGGEGRGEGVGAGGARGVPGSFEEQGEKDGGKGEKEVGKEEGSLLGEGGGGGQEALDVEMEMVIDTGMGGGRGGGEGKESEVLLNSGGKRVTREGEGEGEEVIGTPPPKRLRIDHEPQ